MPGPLQRIKEFGPVGASAALNESFETTVDALEPLMGINMAKAMLSAIAGATSYSLYSSIVAMSAVGPPPGEDGAATLLEGMRGLWGDWLEKSHDLPEGAMRVLQTHLDVICGPVYYSLVQALETLKEHTQHASKEPTVEDVIH